VQLFYFSFFIKKVDKIVRAILIEISEAVRIKTLSEKNKTQLNIITIIAIRNNGAFNLAIPISNYLETH
jgi:hypothetical protein